MNVLQHIKVEIGKSREAVEKAASNDIKQFKGIIKRKQSYFKKLCDFNLTFFAKCELLNKYPDGIFDAEDETRSFLLLKEKLNTARERIQQTNDIDIDGYAEIQQVNIKDYDNLFKMAAYSLNMAALYSMVYNNKVGTFSIGTYPALNKIDELGAIVISKSYELMGYWTARNEVREGKRLNVLAGSRVPLVKESLKKLLIKYDYTPDRLDMRRLKAGFRKDMHELAESLGLSYRSITNRLREIRDEERKNLKTR